MMSFWYHFAILFEALFILTTIDAGTRVARFMIQDLLGTFIPEFKNTQAWGPNLIATGVAVLGWGYFLYQGVIDPLGGINTLWPLFGIANQMLAAIALTLCVVVLYRMKRDHFAFIVIIPTCWLYICTLTAGLEKIFHDDSRIGFLAHARKFSSALDKEQILAPAKSLNEMRRVIFNDFIDVGLCGFYIALILAMLSFAIIAIREARASEKATVRETKDDVLRPIGA